MQFFVPIVWIELDAATHSFNKMAFVASWRDNKLLRPALKITPTAL